ncbi:YoaK family protein [Kitasatospora sp. HPMI-4]|uniref:YoaK family protein n=1 Tax=Kitasatospora sp. HPMI-4 TaxID=3448443 RepID=UPI003F1E298F
MPVRIEVRVTAVLTALTVTSGVIDAVSFLALGHAFAALATGNLLLLAFGVAGPGHLPVARPGMALAGFVLGAVGAHLVIARRLRQGRRWFAVGLLVESAVVTTAGAYSVATAGTGFPRASDAVVASVLITLAMGWRNRIVLQTRVPEMPTTLVQASLVRLIAGTHPPGTGPTALTGVQRVATVAGMFAGGLAGAASLAGGPGPVLLAVAGCTAVVALLYSRSPWLHPPKPADAAG